MINLAVQTLWTKPLHLNNDIRGGAFFGFEKMEYFLASAYLSFNQLKRNGYRVHLYTDNYGKSLLVDQLKLKYDYIDLSHETLDLNPNLWAFCKMYTHLKQTEPFIHVDLDAFIFNDFTLKFKSENIIFQNIESNFDYYKKMWKILRPHIKSNNKISHQIRSILDTEKPFHAMNVGIFGGNNISAIKTYVEDAITFLNLNIKHMPDEVKFYFCIFVEQMYCYYYHYFNNITTTPLYKEGNKQVDDFIDWDNYTHLISSVKGNQIYINKVIELSKSIGYDS